MKRYWSMILLGLFLVTLVMILLHRDVGEAILISLLYLLLIAKLIIHGIPQFVIWLLFLLITFFMALYYTGRLQTAGKAHRSKLTNNTGQVSFWAKRFHKTVPGSYYQSDTAHLLGRLTINILNLRGSKNLKKPADHLVAETSDIPNDIKAYLLAGLEFGTAGIPKVGRMQQFIWRLGFKKAGPLDLDPERVVEFIETISE